MQTTIALDDELVARAKNYTGLSDKSDLVHEALKGLVAREAARRLAALGGSQPGIVAAPRRKKVERSLEFARRGGVHTAAQ